MSEYSFIGNCCCCHKHVSVDEEYSFNDADELVCEDCADGDEGYQDDDEE